jgi:hypothetical protein
MIFIFKSETKRILACKYLRFIYGSGNNRLGRQKMNQYLQGGRVKKFKTPLLLYAIDTVESIRAEKCDRVCPLIIAQWNNLLL